VDSTLQHALRLHEDGDLPAAEAAYLSYLSLHPEDPGALRLLGTLRIQQDDYTDGEAQLRRAIVAAPDDGESHTALADALQLQRRFADAAESYILALERGDRRATVWSNLGLSLSAQADYPSARRCYESALAVNPEHTEALYNLGLLCYELDDFEGAIDAYRRALRQDPIEADVLNNLGNALYCTQQLDEAVAMYKRALREDPGNPVFLRNLGLAAQAGGDIIVAADVLAQQERDPQLWVGMGMSLQRRGDTDGAIDAYRRALAIQPDEPTARHLLDALTGAQPDRAAPNYVEMLFDDYAPRFEGHLVTELAYQIPALMRWLLGELLGADARFESMLDLGCGTGLVGAELRDIVARMVGVDLSEQMLRRCRNRELYDDLYRVDLIDWLSETEETFDLVTAADVIIYLGDLTPMFEVLSRRIRPGGRLLLSTERLEDGLGDYLLRPSGRFAHSRVYLRRLAARFGFTEERLGSAEIRRSKMGWDEGDVVLLLREC
jgi:predicted TPR repeat methyltransferase